MSNLPKQFEAGKHIYAKQSFTYQVLEALTIAVEALKDFEGREVHHCCEDCPCGYWETNAKEALRRIEELGNNGPKKTNNLTYEETV